MTLENELHKAAARLGVHRMISAEGIAAKKAADIDARRKEMRKKMSGKD